jgi:hypothetical protein
MKTLYYVAKNCALAALLLLSLVQWIHLRNLKRSNVELMEQLKVNFTTQHVGEASGENAKLLLMERTPFDFYNAQMIIAWVPDSGLGSILLPRQTDPNESGVSYWAWAVRGDAKNWEIRAKSERLVAQRLGRLESGRISFSIKEDADSITWFMVTREADRNPTFPNDRNAHFSMRVKAN